MTQKTYKYDEIKDGVLKYFEGDELATDVWIKKYCMKDNEHYLESTPVDMHKRMSKEFARIEKNYEGFKYGISDPPKEGLSEYGGKRKMLTEEKILEYFNNFKYIIPQGSVMANLGHTHSIGSLSNCIVLPEIYDSYGGIMYTDQQLVQLMKRRAGIGIDISSLRPKNMPVTNAAGSSTGSVSFMDRFSNTTREVAQNNRRGALIVTIDINHPDIEDFIEIKQDLKKVTGANISIKLTDEFMSCVNDDKDFTLQFPTNSNNPIISKKVKAKDLWNKIINNAWRCVDGETKINVINNSTNITEIIKFSDLYDNKDNNDYSIYSINPQTYKIEKKQIIAYQKIKNNSNIIEIETEYGNKIKGTDDHVIYKLNNNGIESVELENIKIGDYIISLNKTEEIGLFGNDYIELDFTNENFNNGSIWVENINEIENQFDILKNLIGKYDNDGYKLTEYKRKCKIPLSDYKLINNLLTNKIYYIPNTNNNENFKINKKFILTKNICRFFGLWIADGSYHNNSVLIHSNKNEIEYYKNIFNDIKKTFNCDYKIDIDNNYVVVSFYSSFLVKLMKSIGFNYNENGKMIPNFIYSLNSDLKSEFIGGIFDGDGTVNKNGNRVSLSQSNYELLENVKYILQTIGIRSKINKGNLKKNHNFKLVKINYILLIMDKWIIDFKNNIKFKILTKQNKINDFYHSYNGLPCELFSDEFKKLKIHRNVFGTKRISYEKLNKLIFNKETFLSKLISNDLFFDKVIDIKKTKDLDYVYDITVEDNHNFLLANGILSSNCAEPGLIFWDRQHWYSTSSIYPNYLNISTNPCSEICMGGNDSCRLIALNMFNCVINPFTENAYFDFDKWYEISYEGLRLNDDLVDLELEAIDKIIEKVEKDPEPDYIKFVEINTWKELYKNGKNGRRTGLGITALGDTIAAIGLKYDSEESLELVEKIMKKKCEAEFDSSIDMAIERGKFKDFDTEIEKQSHFVKMLQKELPEVYERMMKYGRRNISLSTIAPTGSLSIEAKTSSGIEPVFMLSYKRRKKVHEGEKFDFIDDMGDKWQEFDVFHPKLKMYLDINLNKKIENSPYYGSDANNIDWDNRIRMQSICQKYTTHSISSTLNLPSNVSLESVSSIYFKAWEMGLKGITVYREGSRSGVLVSNDIKENKNILYGDLNAPKRPKSLKCDVVRFTNKGDKWIGFMGLFKNGMDENRPYELFTGLQDSFQVPTYVENGEILKNKIDGISRYDFVYKDKDGYPIIMTGLNRAFDREYWNYGKMISGVLRHGMPIKNVVELIDSLKFTEDNIVTWKAGVKRMLKKYAKSEKIEDNCPNCGSANYFHEAGCDICKDCGYSKQCG